MHKEQNNCTLVAELFSFLIGHEEAITFFKGIEEFYPKGHIEKPLEDSKISRRNVSFFDVMGQHSYKRYNVNFLEDDIIIFITGNKYQTYNLSSKSL